MRLYFLRHAIAIERGAWDGVDSERPLTDEGREQMYAAARGLAALGPRLDAIFTSPYTRAADTARLASEALGVGITVWPELASGCDLEGLAPRLAELGDAREVMLVGHEPDFSAMIGRLIGGNNAPARIELKKGACCRVDVPRKALLANDRRRLIGAGELRWLLTPAQLTRLAPVDPRSNRKAQTRADTPRRGTQGHPTTPGFQEP